MKKLALSALATLTATAAAKADGYTDPIVEPTVIIEEATSSSSQGILIPIMLLIFLAAAFSNGGSSEAFNR